MKHKSTFLTSIALLFTLTATYAQLTLPPGSEVNMEIEGTPYLDDNYLPGVVYQDASTHKSSLRYNMHKDVMEYMLGTVNMYIEPNAKVRKVTIGSNLFVVKQIEFKKKKIYSYLALLDSGQVKLYSKKVVSFRKARQGPAPEFKKYPPTYERESDVFYYQIGDGELLELESIKSMIATLPAMQDELAAFAKKEKISASKEQKVLKFVQYYNSLVALESQGE